MSTAVNNLFSQIIPKKLKKSSKAVKPLPTTPAIKPLAISRCKSALQSNQAKSRRTIKLQVKTIESDVKEGIDVTILSAIPSPVFPKNNEIGYLTVLNNDYIAVQPMNYI